MIAPDKRLDRNPGNPSAERKGSARPSAGERPGEGASQDHPRSPPEETSKMPTLETGKPRARIGALPPLLDAPAGLGGQAREAGKRELVGVLRVQGLARGEAEGAPRHMDRLVLQADEVHLDVALGGVPSGAMGEGLKIEVAAEFAVDALQQVQVERRRDPGGVVVGRDQRRLVLDQVNTDQEGC